MNYQRITVDENVVKQLRKRALPDESYNMIMHRLLGLRPPRATGRPKKK